MGNKKTTRTIKYSWTQTGLRTTAPIPVPVTVSTFVTSTDARTGADNPKYKQAIREGRNATNSLAAYRHEGTFHTGLVRVIVNKGYPLAGKLYDNGAVGINGLVFPDNPVNTSLRAQAISTAAMGIRKKIKSFSQSFSGLTFLGELRESIQLIKKPAKHLFRMTNELLDDLAPYQKRTTRNRRMNAAMRARKSQKKSQVRKAIADRWLEFSFGALPLIADIEAIATAALARIEEERVKRVSFSATAASASAPTISSGITALGGVATADVLSKTSDAYDVKYTCGLKRSVSMSNNSLQNVIDLGGFNLAEIVPTAWELVPWSFLIDYFTNIGDVLGVAFMSMSDVVWSQETIRRTQLTLRATQSCKIKFAYKAGYTLVSHDPAWTTAKRTDVWRVAASIPIPGLRFELPGRPTQFLNMAALLSARIK